MAAAFTQPYREALQEQRPVALWLCHGLAFKHHLSALCDVLVLGDGAASMGKFCTTFHEKVGDCRSRMKQMPMSMSTNMSHPSPQERVIAFTAEDWKSCREVKRDRSYRGYRHESSPLPPAPAQCRVTILSSPAAETGAVVGMVAVVIPHSG